MTSPTRQIARLLGTDNEQAKQFAEGVRSRLGSSIKYRQIAEDLKELAPKNRTIDSVVALYNQKSPRKTKHTKRKKKRASVQPWLIELTEQVQRRLPFPITEDVVQIAVRATAGQHDVEVLVTYLDKYTPLVLLGQELNCEVKEAESFCRRVESSFGYPVSPLVIRESILHLAPDERSEDRVVETLEIVRIAKYFNIQPSRVAALGKLLENRLDITASNRMILQALEQIEGDTKSFRQLVLLLKLAQRPETNLVDARRFWDKVVTALQVKVAADEMIRAISGVGSSTYSTDEIAWQIRIHRFEDAVGDMVPGQARKMLEEIDKLLPSRARSAEVDKVLDVIDDEVISIEEIANQIMISRIASVLRIRELETEEYIRSIETAAGQPFSPRQVLEALLCVETVPIQIADVAALLQTAELLDFGVDDARRYCQRVKSHGRNNIQPREVVGAIRELNDQERVPKTVADYIEVAHRLAQVGLQQRPADIRLRLQADLERPVFYHGEIREKMVGADNLHSLFSSGHPGENTIWTILLLAFLIEEDVGMVRTVGQSAIQKWGQQLDHVRFLAAMRAMPARNRELPRAADYVALAHVIEASDRDFSRLNALVDDLYQEKNRQDVFWRQLKKTGQDAQLALEDLEQLLTISDIPLHALLLLDPNADGEKWIVKADLEQIATLYRSRSRGVLNRIGRTIGLVDQERINRLRTYGSGCWGAIVSDQRRYQVPSMGRAEILASETLVSLIGLHSVRFLQGGTRAPGVFLQFKFGEPAMIGIVRVNKDGILEGFHQLTEDVSLRVLIEATALSYYRDLVLPEKVYDPIQAQTHRRVRKSSTHSSSFTRPRTIPTRLATKGTSRRVFQLEEWYKSQEIARHLVRGHRRRIRSDYEAPQEKRVQARIAGVTLRRGETWVIEHERGNPQFKMPIELDGEDLPRHTLFAPPHRASRELDRLLF